MKHLKTFNEKLSPETYKKLIAVDPRGEKGRKAKSDALLAYAISRGFHKYAFLTMGWKDNKDTLEIRIPFDFEITKKVENNKAHIIFKTIRKFINIDFRTEQEDLEQIRKNIRLSDGGYDNIENNGFHFQVQPIKQEKNDSNPTKIKELFYSEENENTGTLANLYCADNSSFKFFTVRDAVIVFNFFKSVFQNTTLPNVCNNCYNKEIQCEKCKGDGCIECEVCNGDGIIRIYDEHGAMGHQDCDNCAGNGSSDCETCGGYGILQPDKYCKNHIKEYSFKQVLFNKRQINIQR
jgi:hypothetical protein